MEQKLSRRSFLKGTAATGSCYLLSQLTPGMLGAVEQKPIGSATYVGSICEMCSTRCPIEARVVDGKAVFIRGNPLSKSTGGTVCGRGGAGHNQLYDKERLVKPLMRVGQRGEGKWKEVSWDEAYTFIAKNLKEIKEKHGAHTVAFSAKNGAETPFLTTFAGAYGSPNTFDHGSTCPQGYYMGLKSVLGTSSVSRDFSKAKYIINMGHNVYEGVVISYARGVTEALENGAKLISFDPRFSVLSSKATEWHPIKPGGDLAALLGMMYTIIHEELYDKKFVETYCDGFEELKESMKECSPEKMASECGIDAKTLQRIAREFAKAAPAAMVDYGHRSTYTTEEIDLRRAMVIANVLVGNIEKPGGLYLNKPAAVYNKIAGEKVAPELAKIKIPKFVKSEAKRIDGIDIEDGEFSTIDKTSGILQTILDASIDAKPYKLRGWVMTRTNPVMTVTNTQRVIQAMKALDFVAVVDVYMSDTAYFADIVLPESTYLERDEAFISGGGKNPEFSVRQKIVEPIGDTKAYWMIFKELAQKLELDAFFPYKDMHDYRMSQAYEYPELIHNAKTKGLVSFGVPLLLRDKKSVEAFVAKYPQSASKLNKEGFLDAPLLDLRTPSKKIQLFDPVLEKIAGRGGLSYRPVKFKESDELYFIQGKVATHTNAHTHNIKWLNDYMSENHLWVHPKVAQTLGLKTGDAIEVYNTHGKERTKALVTEGIREDTVFAYFGFGRVSKGLSRAHGKGLNGGNLLAHRIAPVTGMSVHVTGVKIRKV